MAGSSVSPSKPLFQEWLSLWPSRLLSPFFSLCLCSWLTRSYRVKPSWAARKLTLRVFWRPWREKIGEEQFARRISAAAAVRTQAAPADELVDALLALGYRRTEAESAAADARQQAEGVEDQLRFALKVLKK